MKRLFLLCFLIGLAFASRSKWMANIDDSQSVSGLSLPGTHNTMALHGKLAGCQTMSLEQQLDAGIRFLDIRCRRHGSSLPIHHGVKFQKTYFDMVLKTIKDFLNKHPSEVVFMRVKKEYKDYRPDRPMVSVVDSHLKQYLGEDKVWMSTRMPKTLGEARGKVVILGDFQGSKWVPYNRLVIDDHWKVRSLLPRSINKKWGYVQANLDKAKRDGTDNTYLTFSSGASAGAYPKRVAKRINPRLESYLKVNSGYRSWGIIAMDYPGTSLIGRIVASNPLKRQVRLSDSEGKPNRGGIPTVKKPSSVI